VGTSVFAACVIIPNLKGVFANLSMIGSAPKPPSPAIEAGAQTLVIDAGLPPFVRSHAAEHCWLWGTQHSEPQEKRFSIYFAAIHLLM
jgi:hypothetical protein